MGSRYQKLKKQKQKQTRWLQCTGIENECPSSHCYSKFGPPPTSSICLPWELIRIADPQAAPSVYWVRICIVTKLQVNSAQMKGSGTTVKPLVQPASLWGEALGLYPILQPKENMPSPLPHLFISLQTLIEVETQALFWRNLEIWHQR